MPTPKSKLSKFILSLPATLTGSEVVERAKAKGMKTSGANVYRVRGLYGTKTVKTASAPKSSTPTTSKPNTPSKSEFIRRIPVSVSAKDVVAQGKAAGLKIDADYVYKIRRTAKTDAVKRAISTPSKSATPSRSSSKISSKADFVRARQHLSPKEIVEDAKAAGQKLDVHYVYRVRAMDKTAKKQKRVVGKPMTSASTNGAGASVASPATSSSAEALLKAIAAELGLGRAAEILAAERARVRGLMGG